MLSHFQPLKLTHVPPMGSLVPPDARRIIADLVLTTLDNAN